MYGQYVDLRRYFIAIVLGRHYLSERDMGCPEQIQLQYMQCNDNVEPALPRIVPNLPLLLLYITTLIQKNTNMNSGQLARTK